MMLLNRLPLQRPASLVLGTGRAAGRSNPMCFRMLKPDRCTSKRLQVFRAGCSQDVLKADCGAGERALELQKALTDCDRGLLPLQSWLRQSVGPP
jgi:hypothetical protein